MKKCCLTCAFYLPQIYDSQVLNIGVCMHLGFFKSGLGTMVNGELVEEHKNYRSRISVDLVAGLQAEGKFWIDILDCRNRVMSCKHYLSALSYTERVMEYYGDSVNNYGWAHPAFLRWIKKGCPVKTKEFVRFRDYFLLDYKVPEVEDIYLEENPGELPYNTCSMCQHFRWFLTPEGRSRPFLGVCKQSKESKGLFSIGVEQREQTTYSFLSCEKFILNQDFKGKNMSLDFELTQKVLPFIETNNMSMSLVHMENFCAFPRVNKISIIDPVEHKKLLNLDLIKMLNEELFLVKRKQFYKDMKLRAVSRFFNARIKKKSKEYDKKYRSFKLYDESSDIYKNIK